MKALLLLLGLVLAVSALKDPQPANGTSKPIPIVELNLDLAPTDRWTELVSARKDPLAKVVAYVTNLIPKELVPEMLKIAADVDKYIEQPYADEIRGVATAGEIALGDAVALNVFYELTAGCTSIVAQRSNGTIYHGRNLDYNLIDMQELAVQVNYVKGGQVLYQSVTFAGYVGILTGVKKGAFSLSVDERDQGGVWRNAIEALLDGGKSLAITLRQVLEKETSFDNAVEYLTTLPLIAPSYIIIGGANPGEGAVITRDRPKAIDVWKLDYPQRWFLTETNYDHWVPPPKDDDRRDPANARMNATTSDQITTDYMYNAVFSTFPVLNSQTVYTALMSAQSGFLWSVTQNNN